MRVLVAGATSVPGIPLLRELNARGHDVIGLTRQSAKTPQIEQAGAKPVVADVFDAGQINSVVADIEPEVMPRRLFGLVTPYGAIAFGDTWLPLSNAKAKAELGWTPIPR